MTLEQLARRAHIRSELRRSSLRSQDAREEETACPSWRHSEESSFDCPVYLYIGLGQDPGDLQEDHFQDRKRTGGVITPDMALRLSRAFNTTPNLWLGLQGEYDLWHAMHDSKEWRQVRAVREMPTAPA